MLTEGRSGLDLDWGLFLAFNSGAENHSEERLIETVHERKGKAGRFLLPLVLVIWIYLFLISSLCMSTPATILPSNKSKQKTENLSQLISVGFNFLIFKIVTFSSEFAIAISNESSLSCPFEVTFAQTLPLLQAARGTAGLEQLWLHQNRERGGKECGCFLQ